LVILWLLSLLRVVEVILRLLTVVLFLAVLRLLAVVRLLRGWGSVLLIILILTTLPRTIAILHIVLVLWCSVP